MDWVLASMPPDLRTNLPRLRLIIAEALTGLRAALLRTPIPPCCSTPGCGSIYQLSYRQVVATATGEPEDDLPFVIVHALAGGMCYESVRRQLETEPRGPHMRFAEQLVSGVNERVRQRRLL